MALLSVVKLLLAIALLASAADAARILAMLPVPGPGTSRHNVFSSVTKALADRGHDVTLFSGLSEGNKINPANNKVIYLPNPFQNRINDVAKALWEQKKTKWEAIQGLMAWGVHLTNATLSSPVFLAEINKPGQKYDLVLAELFFFQEAMVGLGHKFNCPVVAINSFGTTSVMNDAMGNPVNPAWVPSPFLGFSDRMTFTERATNALLYVSLHAYYNYVFMPRMQALADIHFPGAPPVQHMLRSKLGLSLVNSHFTLGYPVPMSPNVVEIGGIHIPDKLKALPKDLQDFMDSAKEGVVYFSLGSYLRVEFMPEDKKQAILGALFALKERVLLKWDGPLPESMPANVKHVQWAPQGDLLAHPNMRVFFTHGGLHSTQESAYHGVPLIGMPVFGDQQFNMMLAVHKGFCVRLEFRELTREKVTEALRDVLQKPKYREAAARLSRLFRAKPLPPVELAVFAVESVLQHGADHLRPASVGMPLYQLLLLDVLAAAAVTLLLLLLCCRALCCGSKKAALTINSADRKKKNI